MTQGTPSEIEVGARGELRGGQHGDKHEHEAPPDQPETSGAQRDDVFELRVHGVSGTSPESLLARPLVDQVAGDGIAGFYRPRLEAEWYDDRPRPERPAQDNAPRLEGYNWGGLTSGSPGRALWLLLLPFTLVNIAPRARPVEPNALTNPTLRRRVVHLVASRSRCVTWYCCRLLALCLTLLLVLTTAGIGIDLVWWQCRQDSDVCRGLPTLVSAVLGWDSGTSLVFAAVVPAILLIALWAVSYGTVGRYSKHRRSRLQRAWGRPREVPSRGATTVSLDVGQTRNRCVAFAGFICKRAPSGIMWLVTAAADDAVKAEPDVGLAGGDRTALARSALRRRDAGCAGSVVSRPVGRVDPNLWCRGAAGGRDRDGDVALRVREVRRRSHRKDGDRAWKHVRFYKDTVVLAAVCHRGDRRCTHAGCLHPASRGGHPDRCPGHSQLQPGVGGVACALLRPAAWVCC